MKILRPLIWILALSALAWSIGWEAHRVHRLGSDESSVISGTDFIETTTVDGVMKRGGKLYDVYSLTPETASIKDCKT
ncbi:MAG: hypothetical protein ACYTGH_00680 [Planctomycetota bacterium]|jgi:hypothetical protein